jgi:site-specific recombinase XerD
VYGRSPYLFVARSGAPLSSDRADDVIVAIGRHSGVAPLSWHRLRHTWAETMVEVLADQANGMDRLVYLGGWKSPSSASRYIQRAIAKQATASVREYQRRLYELESRPE